MRLGDEPVLFHAGLADLR